MKYFIDCVNMIRTEYGTLTKDEFLQNIDPEYTMPCGAKTLSYHYNSNEEMYYLDLELDRSGFTGTIRMEASKNPIPRFENYDEKIRQYFKESREETQRIRETVQRARKNREEEGSINISELQEKVEVLWDRIDTVT